MRLEASCSSQRSRTNYLGSWLEQDSNGQAQEERRGWVRRNDGQRPVSRAGFATSTKSVTIDKCVSDNGASNPYSFGCHLSPVTRRDRYTATDEFLARPEGQSSHPKSPDSECGGFGNVQVETLVRPQLPRTGNQVINVSTSSRAAPRFDL